MYNIKKLLSGAILLGLISFSACSDFLEVSPSDQIPNETAVTTVGEATAALNGVYTGFVSRYYYGTDMITYGDVRGDDMATTFNGQRTYSQFTFGHATALTSTNGGSFWQYIYRNMNRVNNLITKIDAGSVKISTEKEQTTLDDVRGQALALRALMHFDVLKIYGEPYLKNKSAWGAIIADKVFSKNDKPQRSTVEQTYTFILGDLKEALGISTSKVLLNKTKTNGKMSYWAAKALLARVYLYMGDYENAYKEAKDVVTNGGYSLIGNADYVNSWSQEFTTESIFEIHSSETDNADREGIGYVWSIDGYYASIITKELHDILKEDAKDVRLGLLEAEQLDNAGTMGYFINKYPGRNGNVYVNNTRVIRLSDMYLIVAEAGSRTGKSDASTYLNAIRKRANPEATDVTATLDLVMKERRKELFGEGHRFFDIIRDLGTSTVNRVGYLPNTPITRKDQVPVTKLKLM
ncbi:RagB/SusD family nutrient uptake outer membrane protein [Dysgonomonas sp. 511]|uniref:RagB/SusD family nutrient uptake outer membrane protein n=1 Tax=Dysgonomonas sp. 511 TaxID=2302930 RepID=UPI0013D167F7|nr:RagB/SusD family nutrient uptake outer membrane protein [Dysgonomonas sp. 511]NDV77374.1 RagB/SusD family nutrient uptake outer membrane protein [Dysgonomonas sp. 511]